MAENPTKPAETAPELSSQPWLHQHGKEIQAFGTVRQLPLALSYEARMYACQRLNQVLVDTRILYALYKKHHWLMRGATFYQLHLLLDKHASEQLPVFSANKGPVHVRERGRQTPPGALSPAGEGDRSGR
jgi:starvation-inducible DNA-binding protein